MMQPDGRMMQDARMDAADVGDTIFCLAKSQKGVVRCQSSIFCVAHIVR
jgi:hypothetical protein